MKNFTNILLTLLVFIFVSCASSKSSTTMSNGANLSDYKYIVYGQDDDGSAELSDILLIIQNELSDRFIVLSSNQANNMLSQERNIISPQINIKSEKWDGGHTYITISFYDFLTNQCIAVIKSSGIGLSISQDQKIALKAIKKELNKIFATSPNQKDQ